VLDLYETPEGRAWWAAHGDTIDMAFDLRKGSRSWKVLNAYLRQSIAKGVVPEKFQKPWGEDRI
jgi:hypothetical protein